jgi:predicted nuclease of predicted toxin-antitoxin system
LTSVLLDQGISRSAAVALRAAAWDAVHVYEVGYSRNSDASIIELARDERRWICSLDADFHSLLAVAGSCWPSVVRVRQEGLKGPELAAVLLNNWPKISSAISAGALVSITERALRIRELPILLRSASGIRI